MNAQHAISKITYKVKQFYIANLITTKSFKGCYHIAITFHINLTRISMEHPIHIVNWYKPSVGFMKLNTDGLINSIGKGAGGIISDTSANLIFGFSFPLDMVM